MLLHQRFELQRIKSQESWWYTELNLLLLFPLFSREPLRTLAAIFKIESLNEQRFNVCTLGEGSPWTMPRILSSSSNPFSSRIRTELCKLVCNTTSSCL
ncbi:hypothetical protein KC19_VG038400, partial [Ceratodon purpureus]